MITSLKRAQRRFGSPVLQIAVIPLFRLESMPNEARIVAFIAAVWQAFWGDVAGVMVVLLAFSALADTIYGRRMHNALGTFSQQRAELGLQAKIFGIVLCLLVRGFEWWWQNRVVAGTELFGLHTHGLLAAAAASALFVTDLKSIRSKLERMGNPVPLLGRVLDSLDALGRKLLPGTETVRPRREDDNGGGEPRDDVEHATD